ncbi:phage head morphogenesis protein, partial [Riemerella anatipestifer]
DYQNTCCEVEQTLSVNGFDDDFRKEFIKAMQDLYRAKKIDTIAHKGSVRETYKVLYKGVEEGISMEANTDSFLQRNYVFNQKIKDNLWYFSAAKNRADLIALNNLLVDEKGNFKTWSQFKAEAEKILGRSARYLKTEYTTAVAGARMAAKWVKFQEQKHLYPYAKFFVVMDKHTSDICSPLNGVVVPWEHPLLKTHYPPNHFNCRTDVVATRYDEPTPNNEIKVPDIPNDFMNNIGISGTIFSENSKYIKALQNDFNDEEIKDFIYTVMSEEQSFIPRYTSKKTGGILRVNLNADLRDLPTNLHLGKLIVDYHKARVDILAHFQGRKNPEFRIDDITGDATNRDQATKPQNFITNSVKKLYDDEQLGGFNKACLVMNFGEINNVSVKNTKRAASELQESFKRFDKLEFVILIANGKVWRIDRTSVLIPSNDFKIKFAQFFTTTLKK